jgi:hypothetical protein
MRLYSLHQLYLHASMSAGADDEHAIYVQVSGRKSHPRHSLLYFLLSSSLPPLSSSHHAQHLSYFFRLDARCLALSSHVTIFGTFDNGISTRRQRTFEARVFESLWPRVRPLSTVVYKYINSNSPEKRNIKVISSPESPSTSSQLYVIHLLH